MSKARLVVLTGAGISAESGIKTFRDQDGLWEGHDIMEVASPQGWAANPDLVLNFYNLRRRQLNEVSPNAAHYSLVELEDKFETSIITQNVDDLHERAGSKNVMHLHGQLLKSRSTSGSGEVFDCHSDIVVGDCCPKGFQLRPHIVWFGEDVPLIHPAADICSQADIMIIIGTSLQVYPAAGLINYAPASCTIYYLDPNQKSQLDPRVKQIPEKATIGMKYLLAELELE